jgi:hypothetical protein
VAAQASVVGPEPRKGRNIIARGKPRGMRGAAPGSRGHPTPKPRRGGRNADERRFTLERADMGCESTCFFPPRECFGIFHSGPRRLKTAIHSCKTLCVTLGCPPVERCEISGLNTSRLCPQVG